jgi:hypothetical protein
MTSITIKLSGVFRVAVTFGVSGTIDSTAYCRIYRNGTPYGLEHSVTFNGQGGSGSTEFLEDLYFDAEDTLELWCKKNTTATSAATNKIRLLIGNAAI